MTSAVATLKSSWSCPACGGAESRPHLRTSTSAVDAESFVPSSDRFGATVGALRRCCGCGHAGLAQPPDEEVFEGAYEDAADLVSLAEEAGQVRTARRDLELLEQWVTPGGLLEIGSWTGSFLVAAAERGWDARGVEPSSWACARARERGCVVARGMLDRAEPAGDLRAVVARDVVEHLVEPDAGIAAMVAALEVGGVLLVTVPDAGSRLARVMGHRWWSVLPMHVQYFTRSSMTALLERHGLWVEHIGTHPKVFSAGYYADRLDAFLPGQVPLAGWLCRRLGLAGRDVAPDFRDRMVVVARKVSVSLR